MANTDFCYGVETEWVCYIAGRFGSAQDDGEAYIVDVDVSHPITDCQSARVPRCDSLIFRKL